MKYNPSKEIIKNEYEITLKEKNFLNFMHNKLKKIDGDIEVFVHCFIHNTYINVAYIFENSGIFIITDKSLQIEEDIEEKEDKKNINGEKIFLKYFNNYIKSKKQMIFFSNLEKTQEDILNDFKNYYNFCKKYSLENKKNLECISEEFKLMVYSRYGSKKNEYLENIIDFNSKQQELIQKRESFKVKGAAGSGKTLVLLTKVIKEYEEYRKKSLIIVFNITARNMLRQKIENLCNGIDKTYITIVNYHSLEREVRGKKFDNLFIDEAQDFERVWYEKAKLYLNENGKLYIFGDEKQNIYKRDLENKNIYTPISGTWNQLKSSYRMEGKSVDLALNFQKEFLKNYDIDKMDKVKKTNLIMEFSHDENEKIEYKYFENIDSFKNSNITNYIKEIIKENSLEHRKIAIITSEIECILPIMESFKDLVDERGITCEKIEEHNSMEKYELEELTRNRKLNFELFGDFLIFSTVHSFKGMERENIVYIFSDTKGKMEYKMDELIYTGITRSKKNLFLINVGLEKYNEFFFKNIKEKGFDI